MIEIIALTAAGIGLASATVHDIRVREVPDWISYGLIFFGIGLRLIFSIYDQSFIPLLYGIAGFAGYTAVGMAMYYAGQWGGGDAKMMMGLGFLFGLPFLEYTSLFAESFYIGFIVNMLIVGALYGLVWSIAMAILKWKPFRKEFSSRISEPGWLRMRRFALIAIVASMAGAVFMLRNDMMLSVSLTSLSLLILLSLYMMPFIRAIEHAAMFRMVTPDKLTEGDWIADDVVINGKLICGPKDLGIEREKIELLKSMHKRGEVDRIKIKEGIPFLPSFLIAFLLTIWLGNMFMLLI